MTTSESPAPAPSRAKRALDARDWAELRRLSLEPRGFGEDRALIWQYLLDPQQHPAAGTAQSDVRQSGPPSTSLIPQPENAPHSDERQILLDTNRSFVLYPVEDERKDELKHELNEAIVLTFRRRPKLHYFQGYHDIVSVLFLTLPREALLHTIEKMSLHRLRDSMGNGLEPMIGQLRIMKRLLRLADPQFAAIVESTTPLPYYALSNLLTLFSHDVPTLPLIQHVFDYLLCRPPIASIYLAVAVILSHEDAVRKLVDEGEEGMLHSILTTFPPVQDSHGSPEPPLKEPTLAPPPPRHAREETGNSWVQPSPPPSQAPVLDEVVGSASESTVAETIIETDSVADSESAPLLSDSWTATSPPQHPDPVLPSESSLPKSDPDGEAEEDDASTLADTPLNTSLSQSLTELLKRADDLYTRFPPNDPRLAVDRIMGPQSVLFTWSEPSPTSDEQYQITDDEAEAMVDAPELIVKSDYQDEDELEELERRQARRRPEPPKKASPWWPPSPTTVLAGAVLAVSIGIAVYDISRRAQGKRE